MPFGTGGFDRLPTPRYGRGGWIQTNVALSSASSSNVIHPGIRRPTVFSKNKPPLSSGGLGVNAVV